MIFRIWAFAAAAPLGWLAAFGFPHELGALAVSALVVAAGTLGAALASAAARLGDHAPDRAAHVASGATVGLAALPACGAAALRFGPPAWVWLALALAALALGLWRASRATAPAPGPRGQLARALVVLVLATALVVALAVAYGFLAPLSPEPDAGLRAAAFDLDSRVPLRTPARCEPRAARVTTLLDRGAAPRLAPDGATLWFEAREADGRFQVQRLGADGRVVCWTCAEAGNNRRPAPHPNVASVLFDTDRFASWRSPAETEVMVADTRGADGPRHVSRRLTYSPGPDDHALYDPSGTGFVFAHGGDGRFEVQRVSVLGGHGGLMLSPPLTLFRGRSAWVVPLGWSPDGRTLVAGFGQPLAPLTGVRLDPASGERTRIEGGLVADAVSFSADGRTLALATTTGEGAARLVPGALGNALARWPLRGEPRARGTHVAVGAVDGTPADVELGDVTRWGAPTGIALLPDPTGFVLGQRNASADRLVRIDLDCAR